MTRAERAVEDVVAVERMAPGLVRVVTLSDHYVVDARDGGCRCPDAEYTLGGDERCKHELAALLATSAYPAPFPVVDDLWHLRRPSDGAQRLVADGGQRIGDIWHVYDPERDNVHTFGSRAEAEDRMAMAEELDIDAELYPPGETPPGYEGGDEPQGNAEVVTGDEPVEPEVVDHAEADHAPASGNPTPEYDDLPERSVGEDPLEWVPGEFVDEIDGSQAINRKGYEVLSHFYDVDVHAELQVPPEETDFEFCRVKATATTPDGRECEAFGSAHVDRGDEQAILLEMADTRARKRALSIATGVGAIAVEELRNEVEE